MLQRSFGALNGLIPSQLASNDISQVTYVFQRLEFRTEGFPPNLGSRSFPTSKMRSASVSVLSPPYLEIVR